jgi:transcriptional regulator with PAS, ATPase and Fis domain
VGATSEVAVDVRVIAATNAPLEEALRERRFRPDLYYRLNVIRIDIPPIRRRREDLEPLARLLLARHAAKLGRPEAHLTSELLEWIRQHSWPGNVRELSNVLERALTLSEQDAIVLDETAVAGAGGELEHLGEALARKATLADVERAYVRRVLDAVDGNVALAARILGIDRRTVYRKLSELGE